MSDENEVQQDGGDEAEVYNDHSVDNSMHEAVNLWPLALVAAILGALFCLYQFAPSREEKARLIPWGKEYHANGAIILCTPFQSESGTWGSVSPYRTLIRTPQDFIFEVAFRAGSQPPPFGNAIGDITYHECGKADGRVVHCFDSFQFTHGAVVPLDFNGKPITAPEGKGK